MLWVNLLHFYQPYNQQEDILKRIVAESYNPILDGYLERPKSKLVLNINGALLELLFKSGYESVINKIRTLAEKGQVEFTGSAMYHAFLPLLPKKEILRQIDINNEIGRKYFDSLFKPIGFFSPEMAINDMLMNVIVDLGYKWVSCAQIGCENCSNVSSRIFEYTKGDIVLFFRNKRVSSLILSAVARDANSLIKETKDIWDKDKYWFTVMDAETFGHHRIGHEKLLFELLDDDRFETVTVPELIKMDLPRQKVDLRPSTWTNEEQDFWLDREKTQYTTAKSFILWKDPENPIHKLQWQLTGFVVKKVNDCKDSNCGGNWEEARQKLDKALSSDQYWWASTKPWWSLEMIEQGAYMLKDVVYTLYGCKMSNDNSLEIEAVSKVEGYYRRILDQAFEWQRTGYIRKRHLESSATFMTNPFKDRAPEEWFNQMVLEFEDQMNGAARNQEFEKAVKWRDALIKLKKGTDIYDVLHVVDELWSARNIPSVKPFLEHGWNEFSDFAKGFFRGVETREEFEKKKERQTKQ